MKWPRINFAKLLKAHKNGWVGISEDFTKVIMTGKTLTDVRKKAKETNQKVYFFPAGESYSDFVGTER